MLTFTQFMEARHFSNSLQWGVIHPKTGKIIDGESHPTATSHDRLIDAIARSSNRKNYAKYQTSPSNGAGHGYLAVYGVNKANKNAVLKAYDKLPHDVSNHVEGEVEGKACTHQSRISYSGHRLAVYNAFKNHDYER